MKKIGLKWDTIVTDWKRTEKKSLRRQMLSDSQWGQLNREVNLRNVISTVGLKKKEVEVTMDRCKNEIIS